MSQTVEPITRLGCQRCGQILRLPAGPHRAIRCPVCACPLSAPTTSVGAAPKHPEAYRPWVMGVVLGLLACIPLGIPFVTHTEGVGLALGGGLAVLGGILAFLPWPHPAIRAVLTVLAATAGYAVAFAFFHSEDPEARREPSWAYQATAPLPAPPADDPRPQAERQWTMHPSGVVQPLLAVAFVPSRAAAFVSRADGRLELYGCPEFTEPTVRLHLPQPAYRLAVDTRRGRLFAAVSAPKALHQSRFNDPPLGRGNLLVYDFQPELESAQKHRLVDVVASQGCLSAAASGSDLAQALVALGLAAQAPAEGLDPTRAGRTRKPRAELQLDLAISHLMYSEALDCVFYLATGPQGTVLGRIPASDPGAGRQTPLGEANILCIARDGQYLYAGGNRSLWRIDPASGTILHKQVLEGAVLDLGLDEAGRIFITDQSQYPSILVLDARGTGSVRARFSPHFLGPLYLQVGPQGLPVYFCSSSPFASGVASIPLGPDAIAPSGWQMVRLPHPPGVRIHGEFFLSPDGQTLVTRSGQVYRLREILSTPRPSSSPSGPARHGFGTRAARRNERSVPIVPVGRPCAAVAGA